jgi:hypothetical protein
LLVFHRRMCFHNYIIIHNGNKSSGLYKIYDRIEAPDAIH